MRSFFRLFPPSLFVHHRSRTCRRARNPRLSGSNRSRGCCCAAAVLRSAAFLSHTRDRARASGSMRSNRRSWCRWRRGEARLRHDAAPTRRLDALRPVTRHEAFDAQTRPEALLWMRLGLHDRLEQRDSCGADLGRVVHHLRWRPFGVAASCPARLRHDARSAYAR